MGTLLTLTDNAIQAVNAIVSSSDQVPDTGGLRVVAEQAEEAPTGLRLGIAPLPAEDDEVIEEEGARVFLEPGAASLLDEKVLDASVENNQVAFSIHDQAA